MDSWPSARAFVYLWVLEINVLILTQRGNPVAILKSLEDDSHVLTRVCQYRALENDKGKRVAKMLVVSKIKGQNEVLRKYGLRRLDYSVIEAVNSLNSERYNEV